MKFLRMLFGTKAKAENKLPDANPPLNSGDYITQMAAGANLVDGKPTWQYAESDKDDLDAMLKCCEAELKTMEVAKVVAAPFYFERAAILLRKAKQYDSEVKICERYINAVEQYYSNSAKPHEADVRKGPRFLSIQKRITKAKLLQVPPE